MTEVGGVPENVIRDVFAYLDRNGTEKITSAQLPTALGSVGKKLTPDDIKGLQSRADLELEGSLSFDDFKDYVELAAKVEKTRYDVEYAFRVYRTQSRSYAESKEGNPVLDIGLLRRALMNGNDGLAKDEVELFFEGTGVRDSIDLDTFLNLCDGEQSYMYGFRKVTRAGRAPAKAPAKSQARQAVPDEQDDTLAPLPSAAHTTPQRAATTAQRSPASSSSSSTQSPAPAGASRWGSRVGGGNNNNGTASPAPSPSAQQGSPAPGQETPKRGGLNLSMWEQKAQQQQPQQQAAAVQSPPVRKGSATNRQNDSPSPPAAAGNGNGNTSAPAKQAAPPLTSSAGRASSGSVSAPSSAPAPAPAPAKSTPSTAAPAPSTGAGGRPAIPQGEVSMGPKGKPNLLQWCKNVTAGYAHIDPPGLKNFTRDWSNGLAFCALIHRYYPKHLDYDGLDPEDATGNIDTAFKAAKEKLNIDVLLDAEDLQSPEEKSVMMQVFEFYKRFSKLGGAKSSTPAPAPAPARAGAALMGKLESIEQRMDQMTEDDAKKQGEVLIAELKGLAQEIKTAQQSGDEVVSEAVQKYNSLNKAVVERTNTLIKSAAAATKGKGQAQAGHARNTSSGGGPCGVCNKALTGSDLQTAPNGDKFHKKCYKCAGCGRAFAKSVVVVEGKPYCDACGRKAFIRALA